MKKVHRHLKGVHLVSRRRLPPGGLQSRPLPYCSGYFAGNTHIALTIEHAPLRALLLGAYGRDVIGAEPLDKVVNYYLTNGLVLPHIPGLRHQGAGVSAPEVLIRRVIQVGVFDAPQCTSGGNVAVPQEVGEVLNGAERNNPLFDYSTPKSALPKCGVEADYNIILHSSIFFA